MLNVKILTSSMLFFHFHQGAPLSECNKAARGPRSLSQTYGGVLPGPWTVVRGPLAVLYAPGARDRIASNRSQRSAHQGPRC